MGFLFYIVGKKLFLDTSYFKFLVYFIYLKKKLSTRSKNKAKNNYTIQIGDKHRRHDDVFIIHGHRLPPSNLTAPRGRCFAVCDVTKCDETARRKKL